MNVVKGCFWDWFVWLSIGLKLDGNDFVVILKMIFCFIDMLCGGGNCVCGCVD